MALLFQLGLAALVAWGLWTALRPRPAFVVRIKGGVPRVARGTVTQAFLLQIGEACSRHGVSHGVGPRRGQGRTIALAFSGACRRPASSSCAISGPFRLVGRAHQAPVLLEAGRNPYNRQNRRARTISPQPSRCEYEDASFARSRAEPFGLHADKWKARK